MAFRDAVAQAAVSIRTVVQRFALALLVVAAVAAMLIGKADTVLVERTRAMTLDLAAPVLDVLSRPVAAFNHFMADVEEIASLRAENERLREENARLLAWQSVAQRLETENAALKGLLNFRDGPQASYIVARVVGDTGNAFVRTLLLNVGRNAGVAPGQAVMTAEGLAGRITEAGDYSARILLLGDLSSRLPVMVERTRERAILAGDNSATPRLTYLQSVGGVQPGDRIVTSGHGGSFPAGIPVGVVVSSDQRGILVKPFADYGRMEIVRVVDFGVAGLLSDPGRPLPPGGRGR